jgi:AcrR family transcriptional regulator
VPEGLVHSDQPEPATRGPQTQSERTESSRRALMDATISLLAHEGYRAASVTRIQDESGLSRGLVTYHFGSKLKLMEAVVHRIHSDYKEETAAGRGGLPGREQVQQMFHAYLARMMSRPEPSHVMLVLAAESVSEAPELRDAVKDSYRSFRATIGDMLKTGMKDGSVRTDIDPAVHAAVLHGVLRGIVLQYFVDPQEINLSQLQTSVTDMLERDLRP